MDTTTETKEEMIKRLVSNGKYKEAGKLYSPMGVAFYLQSADYGVKVHVGPSGWQEEVTSYEVKEAGKQLKKEIDTIDRSIMDPLEFIGARRDKDAWCGVIAVADDVSGYSEIFELGNLMDKWLENSNVALTNMADKLTKE